MTQDPNAQFTESERAEFARIVDELAKWPRLSHLLRYMGDKLFAGKVDQLTEYNIATEVLGRSKTVFNAGEDAIARVETHRLRKRLAAFYEEEGKDHPIQLTLPAGTYVPVFVRKPAQTLTPVSSDTQTHGADSRNDVGRLRYWITSRRWKHVVAASLVLVGLAAYVYFGAGTSSKREKSTASGPSATVPDPSGPLSLPVRLLAGYSGPPRTDSAGRVWNPDQYFTGGGTWQRTPGFIARTSEPFLFDHLRTGDFSYSIPLKPGSYELHLFFSTPIRANESISTFNVWINDSPALQGFDINVDALGEDVADERVFRDVSPGKDGLLHIGFTGAIGPPTLNAIEILPGVPGAQLPIRLIMQTTPLTDRKGQFWRPDNYFMNGRLSTQTHPLVDSSDPDLFSEERFGHFSYAIPVDTRGKYTLVLHFAEFYFNSAASGTNGRVFKVMCNGQTLLDNFDIFKEAGRLHEVTKTFRHMKPSAQGKLNLTFEPMVNNATVSGIEVLDESQ